MHVDVHEQMRQPHSVFTDALKMFGKALEHLACARKSFFPQKESSDV